MKIQFLKDHNRYKSGDIVEASDTQGKHWIQVKAAVLYTEPEKPKRKRRAK